MRGKILELSEFGGKIKPFKSYKTYEFKRKNVICTSFSELKQNDIVDFNVNELGKLDYIHKTPMQWCEGIIAKIFEHNNQKEWIIKCNNRMYWFKENDIFYDMPSDFKINDIVRFKCIGFKEEYNRAFNVTKRYLGYITEYSPETGEGKIDYEISFQFNPKQIEYEYNYLNSKKYYYLVLYELKNNVVENIIILNQLDEILFDDCFKWHVGKIHKIYPQNKVVIISPVKGNQTLKVDIHGMNKFLDFSFLKEGQNVSFSFDEDSNVVDILWSGYITRFPVRINSNDQSARINPYLNENERSSNENLIYLRKYKINNLEPKEKNASGKDFWITAKIFGVKRKIYLSKLIKNDYIHISTFNESYKVRYAITKDDKNDSSIETKAISVHIIGISKYMEMKNNVISDTLQNEVAPTVINNFYGNCYQLNNFRIHTVDDFVRCISDCDFFNYLKAMFPNYRCEEDIDGYADKIANKIFPIEFEKITDVQTEVFNDKYNASIDDRNKIEDSLLEKLSPKCTLYVKVAIIVDRTLSESDISISDLSPRMVMYGKALEQCLRDCLYDIIIGDDELKDFKLINGQTFSNIERDKTMIGMYTTIIFHKLDIFIKISQKTTEWFRKLYEQINEARELRNSSDHAGNVICEEDVVKMFELMFDKNGIFNKLLEIKPQYEVPYNNKIEEYQEPPTKNSVSFIYKKALKNTKTNKIYAILGYIAEENCNARLDISQMKNGYVTQEQMIKFVDYCEQNQKINVKKISKNEKGWEVSLIDTLDFDVLISK